MKKYVPFNLMALMVGLAVLIIGVACEEDEGIEPYEPYYLVITGPTEVAPGDTVTYTANTYENESYTWTVPTGAALVSGEGNDTVSVVFSAASEGNLTVAARGLTESVSIDVEPTLPTPTVNLEDTVLAQGATRDIVISFEEDIETAPAVTFVSDSTTQGGAIEAIERIDDRSFRVSYTAGSGDGRDRIEVTGARSNAYFGAQTDTLVSSFGVYTTDNTQATGTLEASLTPVSPGQSTIFTATLSEQLYVEQDSLRITIMSADDNLFTSDTTYVENAIMSTLDGVTWTYEFEPGEDIEDDLAIVSVSTPTDLAGNVTEAIEPIFIEIKENE